MGKIYEFSPDDAYRFSQEQMCRTKQRGDELQFYDCPYCHGASHHCTTKRYLDMLKSAGMIQVDSNKRATLISIVNYQQYQGFEHGKADAKCTTDYPLSSALSSHSLSTDYQQTTMYNNVINNENNEEQIEPASVQEERLKKYLGVTGNKEKYCFGKGFMMVGKVKGTGGRSGNPARSSTTT